MNASQWLERMAPSLRRLGLDQYEIFQREGRSRRFEIGTHGVIAAQAAEVGWAVRATGPRTSMFAAGTGEPPANGPWPQPDGYPVPLPPPFGTSGWTEPAELELPLAVESEAVDLLDACARELERELPGSRLLRGVLEDGASTSQVVSSLGIDATVRARSAALYLEAVASPDSSEQVTELIAVRSGRSLNPRAIARRLADRLIVRSRGAVVSRDRAACLLGPAVAVRILGGLLPILLGREASENARKLMDRQGRIASTKLSIIDDPRLEGGLFCAGSDGEGVPTRALLLIKDGGFRQALLPWWQQDAQQRTPAGCLRRSSWREPPRLGPSHLFVMPDLAQSVPSLLTSLTRGYYLLDSKGAAELDVERDRFRLPVSGFEVADGEARQPIAGCVLRGRITSLLHGIQGIGRDLMFYPAGGAIGSPSLLVQGLEIASA